MKEAVPRTNQRHLLISVSVLLWVALIFGLYYWVHKPLTPALAEAIAGALLDVGLGIAFLVIAGGIGRRILTVLLGDLMFWNTVERIAATALFGLSALSLVIMLVGVFTLDTACIAIILAVVVILVLRDELHWLADLRAWLGAGFPVSHWERFIAASVMIVLAIALLLAVMPPAKWDVLTYHLAGSQQYIQHGRFYAATHNHFLGFPQLLDTLFTGQLALTGRLTGAAIIHWMSGILLLMAVAGYVVRRTDAVTGWFAAAVIVTMPSIWLEMTVAYVDLMPVGLAVVALSLADEWRIRRADARDSHHQTRLSWRYLIGIGALIGFGLGVKYTVLWLAVAVGILILWIGRQDGPRCMVSYGTIYSVTVLLVFAPWLVRNAVWYENPLYPFLFEGAEMDVLRQEWYSQPGSGLIHTSDAWQLPLLPITATILGVESAGLFGADVGPLYLILIPLLPLSWAHLTEPARQTVRLALIVVTVIGAAWWISAATGSYISLQTRLVFYVFGPLALVASLGFAALQRLPKKPFDLYFVLRALVSMTFVFTVVAAVQHFNNSGVNLYFSGKADYEERYLEHTLGWHYKTMQQINTLPPDTTVRFLWEPRYLYCDNKRLTCYPDALMDAWYYARRTIGDGHPSAIADAWHMGGIDYLLVYEFGRTYERDNASLYEDADWDAWASFVDEYLSEEWRNGNAEDDAQYILYRWRD